MRSTGGAGGALAGARQASPRTLGIGGAILAIVVVAVVLAVVLGRSSGPSTTGSGSGDTTTLHVESGTPHTGSATGAVALPGATDVASLLHGIPESHFVLGNPNAPVQLTEFIDLQCPVCRAFETTEMPTLIKNYVRTGKLSIRMEPWNILDRPGTGVTDSARGQKATIAAASQNKAFDFAQVLYDNQGTEDSHWMNDAMISQIAASVNGLHPYQLVTDANSSGTKSVADAVSKAANGWIAKNPNFDGTPSILLTKIPGKAQYYGTGLPTLSNLEAAINADLK